MRALVGVGLAIALLLAWGYWSGWGASAVTQPIQFPHKAHLELRDPQLTCTSCHERAEKEAAAGRPSMKKCLSCHAGGEARSPEEKKLQAFGQTGEEIPWRRVWRLPPHVFFSHRTHVAAAKVKCQTCHGPMETLSRPPARPLRRLGMDDCVGCHERWEWPEPPPGGATARRVSVDCNACHR